MSHYQRYSYSDVSSDGTSFEFTSEGPKGKIRKKIQFEITDAPNIFNLSFGNINKDGRIDDLTTNDNEDRDKILATVADAVYNFTKHYHNRAVYFEGSTTSRTRLYRIAISVNYETLARTFDIWGLTETGFIPFQPGLNCSAFLIKRK